MEKKENYLNRKNNDIPLKKEVENVNKNQKKLVLSFITGMLFAFGALSAFVIKDNLLFIIPTLIFIGVGIWGLIKISTI